MPENIEQRQSVGAKNVLLWTLAVVTVTVVAACLYIGFGQTSVDRDFSNNLRLATVANGTAGNGTNDLNRREDPPTRKIDRIPNANKTQAATVTINNGPAAVHWTADNEIEDEKIPSKEDRMAGRYEADDGTAIADVEKVDRADDVSHGFYRTTDGSDNVIHKNVYSTIDAGRFPGDVTGPQSAMGTHVPESTGADDRNWFDYDVRPPWPHPADHMHYGDHLHYGRRPPLRIEYDERPAHKTDWRTVGALVAVAKLAFAKLAAVGLLQFAFVVAFKLFLVAAALSVKWLLLLKLGKLFHALTVVPLLLLLLAVSLSPTLVRSLMDRTQALQSASAGSAGASGFSSGSFQTVPAVSGSSFQTIPAGSSSSFQTIPAGSSSSSSLQMLPGTSGVRGRTRFPATTTHYYDGLPSDVLQNVMQDLEGCVERVACRMAAAQKAGNALPASINRILNGVSRNVPDQKIKLYLKTYNDAIIGMYAYSTPSSSRENWESWCLERYDCNGANATTTVTGNKI